MTKAFTCLVAFFSGISCCHTLYAGEQGCEICPKYNIAGAIEYIESRDESLVEEIGKVVEAGKAKTRDEFVSKVGAKDFFNTLNGPLKEYSDPRQWARLDGEQENIHLASTKRKFILWVRPRMYLVKDWDSYELVGVEITDNGLKKISGRYFDGVVFR